LKYEIRNYWDQRSGSEFTSIGEVSL